MTQQDIIAQRLVNEKLTQNELKSASALVEWFGAVQSQDFPGAKWGLGQRLGLKDRDLDSEFNEGKILRTHIMRPTWHFVHPKDIVWMQKLTSPRVNQIMSYYNRVLGLDREYLNKTNKVIIKSLTGGKFLTRAELAKSLEKEGFSLKGQKLGHVVSQAELDAIICSGPRVGKQFTYALISERIKDVKVNRPKDLRAELVKRFFQSHGPATVKDFVWWSGLTTKDANEGIKTNKLESEIVDGKKYYYFKPKSTHKISKQLFLLPNYDEYTIAYKDRDAFLDQTTVKYFMNQGNASFWNSIVYEGKIIGMWKRIFNKSSIQLHTQLHKKLTQEQSEEFKKAIVNFENFFNLKVEVVMS